MSDRLIRGTKYLLDFMFYSGILVTMTVPVSFKLYSEYNSRFVDFYVELVLIFIASGILAVLIIRELRKVFDTVLRDDCFVRANVKCLKRMGNYSFAIVVITMGRLFLYLTPTVFVFILTFTVAGLFCKVLSEVFDKAVAYKLENDLTI